MTDPTSRQPDADNLAIIRGMPIKDRITWLMHRARAYSTAFQSPESVLARKRYIAQHPTGIIAFNCMDGRINTSVATDTPAGIILPLRNLGGRFDLGWPYFGEVLSNHIHDMVGQGRRTMALITYHYSKGDTHRGCAGFNYNTDAARRHTFEIQRQVEAVYGKGHSTVYPLVCGFETDEDALVLHGSNGEILDLSTVSFEKLKFLPASLAQLYPDMSDQMRQDLLPLVQGNISHIARVKQTNLMLSITNGSSASGAGSTGCTHPIWRCSSAPTVPTSPTPSARRPASSQPTCNAAGSPMTAFCCWPNRSTMKSVTTVLAPNSRAASWQNLPWGSSVPNSPT
jgi:hypothetical protein